MLALLYSCFNSIFFNIMSISCHSWMLSNESISGTEKVSLLFCLMTILFYLQH